MAKSLSKADFNSIACMASQEKVTKKELALVRKNRYQVPLRQKSVLSVIGA
jgi:hypothetical protein